MEQKKRDLIVFGEDWGALPSSTQHIMKELSQERRIIWVNSIGLRRLSFNYKDIKRAASKLFVFFSRGKSKQEKVIPPQNITVVNPLTIPAPKSTLARKVASYLLTKQVHKKIDKKSLYQPILWTSLPTSSDLIGRFNESANVYYCGDDFSSLAGVDHDVVERHEESLTTKSHLIITASERLNAKFPQDKTHTLHHGVDFDLFSTPQAKALDFPDRQRPTAGFYGSLSQWLDIELLSSCARALPNWNFVFIGKEDIDVSKLKALPNCFFLGERAHSELPSYSQHWDVSLLPFKRNQQIEYCRPLKLYEYLATGKPIVATDFPAVRSYKDLIQCVKGDKEFILALKMSLELSAFPKFKELSRNRVKDNTWQCKSQKISAWLDAL